MQDGRHAVTTVQQEIRTTVQIGVIAERRRIAHPWQEFKWMPVAIIVGAGPVDEWVEIAKGENFTQYHIDTLPLELFRKETDAYRTNLSNSNPSVYVVLREAESEDEPEIRAVFTTASPFEAQDYLDSGEDIVEALPMPEDMENWIRTFIDIHHEDEPFKKRKRKNFKEEEALFGKELHPMDQRFFDPRKMH